MTKGIIKIVGFLEKGTKENKDGSFSLMFKVPHFNEEELNQKESYCVVIVGRERYGQIKKTIGENTFCYVEGSFKVGKNSKEVPYITIKCQSIKAATLLTRDFVSNSLKLTDNFPWGTEELVDLSSIIIPENLTTPNSAKKKALDYVLKHGNFENPILINPDSLTIIEGYAYYLVAQELGIRKVPVSYMKQYYKPLDEDYGDLLKSWHEKEEVTQIHVKDIAIEEDIHLKVKHFSFHFDLDNYSKNPDKYHPVAVRPSENGKYILVIGASRYFAAKIMDVDKIPAVIKNMNHEEFIKHYTEIAKELKKNQAKEETAKGKMTPSVTIEEIEMSKITVPDNFENTPPRREKVNEAIEYYKKHDKFDKPIVVKGSNYTITDGYKRYVAAKELNLTKILAKVIL